MGYYDTYLLAKMSGQLAQLAKPAPDPDAGIRRQLSQAKAEVHDAEVRHMIGASKERRKYGEIVDRLSAENKALAARVAALESAALQSEATLTRVKQVSSTRYSRLVKARWEAKGMIAVRNASGELIQQLVGGVGPEADLMRMHTAAGADARRTMHDARREHWGTHFEVQWMVDEMIDAGKSEDFAKSFAAKRVESIQHVALWSGMSRPDAAKWCADLDRLDPNSPYCKTRPGAEGEAAATAAAMVAQRDAWKAAYEASLVTSIAPSDVTALTDPTPPVAATPARRQTM